MLRDIIKVALTNSIKDNNRDSSNNELMISKLKKMPRMSLKKKIITKCLAYQRRPQTLKSRKHSKRKLYSTILTKIRMTQMVQKKSSKSLQMHMKSYLMRIRGAFMINKVQKEFERTTSEKLLDNLIWMTFSLNSSVVVEEAEVEDQASSSISIKAVVVDAISNNKKSSQLSLRTQM